MNISGLYVNVQRGDTATMSISSDYATVDMGGYQGLRLGADLDLSLTAREQAQIIRDYLAGTVASCDQAIAYHDARERSQAAAASPVSGEAAA